MGTIRGTDRLTRDSDQLASHNFITKGTDNAQSHRLASNKKLQCFKFLITRQTIPFLFSFSFYNFNDGQVKENIEVPLPSCPCRPKIICTRNRKVGPSQTERQLQTAKALYSVKTVSHVYYPLISISSMPQETALMKTNKSLNTITLV